MRPSAQIQSGFTVYGSDGNKIGTVKHCYETYCHIDTGFLGLGPDYFVPMSDIRNVTDEGLYLDVPSDRIAETGWVRPPAEAGRMAQAGLAEESMAARARPLAEAPEARPLAEAEALRTIPLAEEDLHVERSAAQVGEVDIGKRVVEERRTIEVPVTREEVFIREHKVDRPAERPVGESFEAIRIPVNEERVSLQKEARVYGEIEVGKRKVTEQKQFTETVRREVPEVERKGDVERLVKSNLTEAERARLESQRASRELRR